MPDDDRTTLWTKNEQGRTLVFGGQTDGRITLDARIGRFFDQSRTFQKNSLLTKMSTVDRGLIIAARLLVIASLFHAAVYGVLGLDLFEWQVRPFILVWIAVPIPLAYWFGTKLARRNMAFAVLLFGLSVVFAFAACMYWDITWGPARRTESMSGLLFIFRPLYQLGWLTVVLLIAALIVRHATAK